MASDLPAAEPPEPTGAAPTRLILIMASVFFMEALDGTVIVTALPQMARSFGVRATDLSLPITAYLVMQAAFIPLSGWAADRFGSRTVFASAIVMFTLSSVACGLSDSVTQLVAARVAQGFAAALMTPVGRLVVVRTTPKASLMRALQTMSWPTMIAPLVGPPIGGFIATYADWRWIFYVNIPLGLIGLVLALRFVPQHRAPERQPFDILGFTVTAASLACLIYSLDLLSRRDAQPVLAVVLLAVGVACGAISIRHSLTAPRPLIDLGPMKIPTFRIAAISAGAVARFASGSVPFLMPLMFQLAYGLSAASSGLLILVFMAGNLSIRTIATTVVRRVGFRRALVAGGLATGVTMMACGFLDPTRNLPLVLAVLFAAGGVRAVSLTAMNALTFADVGPENRGGANLLWHVVPQMALSAGVGAAAVLLNLSLKLRGGETLAAWDFHVAFLVMGAVAIVAGLWFSRLAPDAGAEVSGHRPRG
jgi:EmrB/QacA subfamily drug resistance transporter